MAPPTGQHTASTSTIPRTDAEIPNDTGNDTDTDSLSPLTSRTSHPHTSNPDPNPNPETHHPSTITTRLQQTLHSILSYLQEQWFLLALGVLILIASQHQIPSPQQDLKEALVTYICVSLIFFITGCTLPTRTLLANYSRWKLHIFVQVQCFLVTSATVFGVVSAVASPGAESSFLDDGLLVGLILMGVVPTTISSNVVLTRQAGGNTALTVVQSTLGNLLGPFLVPLLMSLYTGAGQWYTDFLPDDGGKGEYGEVYKRVLKQLGLSLFLPLLVGQGVQNVFPQPTEKVMKDWKLSKISSLCLLAIIWSTYDQAFESGAFATLPGSNMVFIVFISIALFLLWLSIGFLTARLWLKREDVVAVCYCVPAKTPAMGVPLVQTIYAGLSRLDQSKLQIPMVIFQGLQIAGGSLLIGLFRWWVQRGEDGDKKRSSGGEEGGQDQRSD